ncbi:hypothetical protein AVEN_189892-1 [Araneus ventricosus]|uniref:Uncharacterized protein n=1 Tax=Araneus ventricosus TaxID=182803 RepID=A0A4Y2M0F9_ARAVE|nr:hypothetical protein AVEN_189892-1 [Araneus ventricosus]
MECEIHLVKDCVDAIQCCSAVSLEKIKLSANQWILTDGEEKEVATQLKASFAEDNIQQSICYHRRCYMRFTDKTRIIAAIKRKQREDIKVLESKEKSNKSFEMPSKPQMRINSLTKSITRSKNVLSKLCIICKKKKQVLDKITQKRIIEKLTQCETNSNLLLKAALQKKDEGMLLQIRGKDLVAMKVCYHSSCYKNYTRFLTRPASVTKEDKRQHSFSKFCKDVIEERIIEQKKILLMDEVKRLFVKTVFEEENLELQNYTNGNLKRKLKIVYPQLRFVKLPIRTHCELVLHENT